MSAVVQIVQQVARDNAFNRPLGADRHEDGRLDLPVGGDLDISKLDFDRPQPFSLLPEQVG